MCWPKYTPELPGPPKRTTVLVGPPEVGYTEVYNLLAHRSLEDIDYAGSPAPGVGG